ncbi:hypothetical protein KHA93_18790 [Bacillus sp. FJAT-49732]|uniref:Uncharacterized protein n=1 Tax=Lederbergia citrisecunda TaxID=2833583 RepID=A0A942TQT7_9BACI|nr:hypothetical protein [Lederbergia citrisecunda]MBS4201653.1 hypothetical protein [Lederbergia citrisecunda]
MQILLLEIRKILNWKILLVLAFVNLILYYFLIDFNIKHFPNGRPALDSYRIGAEMVKNYGPEMDESEKANFRKKYEEEVRKADEFFQSREDFKKVGVQSYEEFENMDRSNEVQMKLREKVIFGEEVDLFWELQERERLLEFHQDQEMIINNEINRADSIGQKHLITLKRTGQFDLYPEVSLMNFKDIITNIAIAVLISVVLVISPIFLSDRTRNLVDLQYTSKIGRSIFMRKLAAGLISAFIVMTGLLAIYLSIYSLNNPSIFFEVPLNSFIGGGSWYNLTFFQYILLSTLAIYVLGFLLTLVSMGISNIVPSFIALIGIQVPIILALLIFGIRYLLNLIISMWLPIWLVPACYIALIGIVIGSVVFIWNREKKLDIVL